MLWGIRIARGLSATVEVLAALALLRMTDVRSMLRLTSALGLIGQLVFITVSALGIAAGLGTIQPARLALVFVGVVLVLLGTR